MQIFTHNTQKGCDANFQVPKGFTVLVFHIRRHDEAELLPPQTRREQGGEELKKGKHAQALLSKASQNQQGCEQKSHRFHQA